MAKWTPAANDPNSNAHVEKPVDVNPRTAFAPRDKRTIVVELHRDKGRECSQTEASRLLSICTRSNNCCKFVGTEAEAKGRTWYLSKYMAKSTAKAESHWPILLSAQKQMIAYAEKRALNRVQAGLKEERWAQTMLTKIVNKWSTAEEYTDTQMASRLLDMSSYTPV